MPPSFDRSEVEDLLARAEDGQNAIVLKVGYFGRRGAVHAFPATEGFTLLKEAVAKEPTGAPRWFVLQAIVGFAGLRLNQNTREDGFRAYEELFSYKKGAAAGQLADEKVDVANEALQNEALQRAIYEFASIIPTNIGVKRLGGRARTKTLLLAGFALHLDFARRHPETKRYLQVWGAATQAVQAEAEMLDVMYRHLEEPGAQSSYVFLRTAAELLRSADPKRAVQILQEANKLLPTGSAREVASLQSELVAVISQTREWPRALEAQRKLIQQTGRGYSQLVLLLYRSQDEKGLDTVIESLFQPGVNPDEVIETAEGLMREPGEIEARRPLWDRALKLLTHLLDKHKPISAGQELQARLLTGQIYESRQQFTQAKAILRVGMLVLKTDKERNLYAAVKQSLERVSR